MTTLIDNKDHVDDFLSQIDETMTYPKPQLMFLDTETTGLEDPKIIQLAYKYDSKYFNKFYGTDGHPIDLTAMSIHNITEDMVRNCPSFDSSSDKKILQKILNDAILIAHNAKFDIGVLKKHGVETYRYIDTLKIARYIWPELEQHKQQYLRHYLNLSFNQTIEAHNALHDIQVLEGIFQKMFGWFKEKLIINNLDSDEITIYNIMINISQKPSLLYKCNFGKYKGLLWESVKQDYLARLLTQKIIDEDILYTIKYYYTKNQFADEKDFNAFVNNGFKRIDDMSYTIELIQHDRSYIGEKDGRYYYVFATSEEKLAKTGIVYECLVYKDKATFNKKLTGNQREPSLRASLKEHYDLRDNYYCSGMMFDNDNNQAFTVYIYNNPNTKDENCNKLLVIKQEQWREKNKSINC